MSHIDNVQLRRLDLGLLLVFSEVYDTGKLSAAADRLRLTQSAVSHAVGRLREIFGDELFVRLPHGVQPTSRARALRGPLAEALGLISNAVTPPAFDPDRDERVFKIAGTDQVAAIFASRLARDGRSNLRFEFVNLIRKAALDALHAGEIDIATGFMSSKDGRCVTEDLYAETYRVCARRGHPVLEAPMTLVSFTRCGHVLCAPGGGMAGIVDDAIEAHGTKRQVVLSVPSFFTAFAAVAASDHLVTAPRRFVECYAGRFGLVSVEPPFAIRPFSVRMAWSRRHASDPAIQWLRRRFKALAGDQAHAPDDHPGSRPGVTG